MRGHWFTKDKLIILIILLGIILIAGFTIAARRIVVVTNNPDAVEEAGFYVQLGNLFFNRGWKEDSLALMEKGLEKDPDNAVLLHNIGVYYSERDDSKAIDYFIQAINLQPDYQRARVSLATFYNKLGRYDEAIEQLRLLVELDPNNPSYHYDLGINLADKFRTTGEGSLSEAIGELERANSIMPGYAAAENNIEILKKIEAQLLLRAE